MSMFKNIKVTQRNKKKPPPRPPPPDLSKIKSKSTVNLVQQLEKLDLIEWSPPSSPKVERRHPFSGSVSSSFSSSTSSLASSKKSYEYDSLPFNTYSCLNGNVTPAQSSSTTPVLNNVKTGTTSNTVNPLPSLFGPTIIRAAPSKKKYLSKPLEGQDRSESRSPSQSPPMPTVPPPSPPKEVAEVTTPYGIAIYDFPATHPSDLPLQVDDIVILHRRVNDEWLYGQVGDREGMFPSSFIDIVVPLPEEEAIVIALYEFKPQMPGDLGLVPGQKVHVMKKISNDWLYGESNGNFGQFPTNFVNRVPKNLQC